MSNFTYQKELTASQLETYEWDNNWLEHCEDTSTPRVLYIGDSISCATRISLNQSANRAMLFDGFGTSKALDNEFFIPSVRTWADQQRHRRFVLFNNGLHGWHLSNEEYAALYERFVIFLKKDFSDSQIVLLLTTHITDIERDKIVVERNQAVLEIAKKHELPIIDLYSLTLQNQHLISSDGVHLLPEGYEIVANKILTCLHTMG
jgi:hypothetical protein